MTVGVLPVLSLRADPQGRRSNLLFGPAGLLRRLRRLAMTGSGVRHRRRPLILLVRETPLHAGHLRLMLALAELGALILPPIPAFYGAPRTIDDLVNHTIGRVLDHLGLEHSLYRPWTGRP